MPSSPGGGSCVALGSEPLAESKVVLAVSVRVLSGDASGEPWRRGFSCGASRSPPVFVSTRLELRATGSCIAPLPPRRACFWNRAARSAFSRSASRRWVCSFSRVASRKPSGRSRE